MPAFIFQTDRGPVSIAISKLIVAGWTGRNAAVVQHHIEELAELGVPAPSTVPLYYQLGPELLTQVPVITALGPATSGEVEPLIVADEDGALWLGLASDHTDRALETISVAKSKQACPKPIAQTLWRFDSVSANLDDLILSAHILEQGKAGWTQYQTGTLAAIKPLAELLSALPGGRLAPGAALLCGTLPALGGIRTATDFRMTLQDPASGRTITHQYQIATLPIIS